MILHTLALWAGGEWESCAAAEFQLSAFSLIIAPVAERVAM